MIPSSRDRQPGLCGPSVERSPLCLLLLCAVLNASWFDCPASDHSNSWPVHPVNFLWHSAHEKCIKPQSCGAAHV